MGEWSQPPAGFQTGAHSCGVLVVFSLPNVLPWDVLSSKAHEAAVFVFAHVDVRRVKSLTHCFGLQSLKSILLCVLALTSLRM